MQETHRAEGNANNSRVINEKPRNPIVILIEMAKGNVRNVFLLKSGGSCGAISRKQGARYIHRADSLLAKSCRYECIENLAGQAFRGCVKGENGIARQVFCAEFR